MTTDYDDEAGLQDGGRFGASSAMLRFGRLESGGAWLGTRVQCLGEGAGWVWQGWTVHSIYDDSPGGYGEFAVG